MATKFQSFRVVTRKEDGAKFLNVVSSDDIVYPLSGKFEDTSKALRELGKEEALAKLELRTGTYGVYASLNLKYDAEEFEF